MQNNIKNARKEKDLILGIDPGYERLGLALIENKNENPQLVYSECFQTNSELSHFERLRLIISRIKQILDEFEPSRIALETLIFSKNVKTALKIAEVRGIILGEGAYRNIFIQEFHPNEIKIAITGFGKADKKQIIFMVEKILKLNKKLKYDDEYDAIAIALTAGTRKLST